MLDERENYSLEEMDRQSLFHPLTSIAAHMKSGPLIVEKASGVRIKDHRGRDMIDCGAGLDEVIYRRRPDPADVLVRCEIVTAGAGRRAPWAREGGRLLVEASPISGPRVGGRREAR